MDLWKGYCQVRIAEGDEPKTTCVTKYGSYKWLVMPFSSTNATATFCMLMNKIFHPYLDNIVVVHLDDIVIKGEQRKDQVKIPTIQEWEAPTKVTELRSFLRHGNYFCSMTQEPRVVQGLPEGSCLKKEVMPAEQGATGSPLLVTKRCYSVLRGPAYPKY
uniref:Reverse transcriptase domain-containing protein n=1 Tax=Solanum lycopersicum TaxID=4081 RepID=A0A3Q7I4V7_SOLLC